LELETITAASTALIRTVVTKAKEVHNMSSARCVFFLNVDEDNYPVESIIAVSIIFILLIVFYRQ
jgi:hypothetical protein